MKLPKQWKDWCRAARLKPRNKGRDKRGLGSTWLYLHGHGREWRVNRYQELECGDTYDEFDRWALCHIASAPLPTSKVGFVSEVKRLLIAVAEGEKL